MADKSNYKTLRKKSEKHAVAVHEWVDFNGSATVAHSWEVNFDIIWNNAVEPYNADKEKDKKTGNKLT